MQQPVPQQPYSLNPEDMDWAYIGNPAGFSAGRVKVFSFWVLLGVMETRRAGDYHSLAIHLPAQLVADSGRILMTDGPMSWQIARLLPTSFLLTYVGSSNSSFRPL